MAGKTRRLRRVALAVLTAVFLVSGGLLVRDLVQSAREQETNRGLAEQVRRAREELQGQTAAPQQGEAADPGHSAQPADSAPPLSPYAESGVLRQYDALWQQNNDMAGWLWIEGTEVEYPVMYTPDEPERYLHRDFFGAYAAGGCLFMGEGGGPDAAHIIVFGHHMKNGSMFGQLNRYQSADYAAEHPVIHLDTLTEEREYEVVAAFYSRVYEAQAEGVFRYYQYVDLSDEAQFEAYMRQVRGAALYDTGVEAEFGQRILVLSTCSYHTDNGRFAVVARQKT